MITHWIFCHDLSILHDLHAMKRSCSTDCLRSIVLTILTVFFSLVETSQALNETVVFPVHTAGNCRSLNGVWQFKYLPSLNVAGDSLFYQPGLSVAGWDSILVPGNWDMQGFGEATYQRVKDGTGLFRTEFRLPVGWQEQQVYLQFDGVLFTAEVYLNGHYVGYWASAYNPVIFDVTRFIHPYDDNVLAVKVTSGGRGSDFDLNDAWAFYGIFRDVTLFAAPVNHFLDYTLVTKLSGENAQVDLTAVIACAGHWKKLAVRGELCSDEKQNRLAFSIPLIKKQDKLLGHTRLLVDKPRLWTAETPTLYTLRLRLYDNGKEVQTITERIGLREVSIQDSRLLLNGIAVKLRGIDIHQTSPDRGNAVPEEYLLRDFILLKRANINFVRTSHYPPPPLFIHLCDSLGFYVMEEVPFGDGDAHLSDSSYQAILDSRARATVTRDKNRPSIIVWSLGNENPVTPLTDSTAHYVKRLDQTRPLCYPQTGPYFHENHQRIREFIDIYAPHYTVPERLAEYSVRLARPVIVTEYAHSLGLDMDMMQNLWEIMYHSKIVAGGGVWDFADQGILRTALLPVDKNKPTPHVWIDSYHYYDAYGSKGTDGIVYADRTPQPDYFQVKNVYAPMRILIDSLTAVGGSQTMTIPIENRYDFINLSAVKTVCGLYHNKQMLHEENLALDIAPHCTGKALWEMSLPEHPEKGYYFLKFNFYDNNGLPVYEKVIQLWVIGTEMDWLGQMGEPVTMRCNHSEKILTVITGPYTWSYDQETGSFALSSGTDQHELIHRGMMLRVGRKPTLASQSVLERRKTENADYLWLPYVLDHPQQLSSRVETLSDSVVLVQKLLFKRGNVEGQFVEGTIRYVLDGRGWIHVHYHFSPIHGTGVFLEAGVSFDIAKELTQMRWIGLGPFPSFPDKDALDQFGIYQLSSQDLYFQGNRGRVQAAIFSDNTGRGVMVLCDNGNLAVENVPDGIRVSHNAQVSSRFNKFVKPLHEVSAASTREFSGRFSLRPIGSADWPGLLQDVFGNPLHTVEPFSPFYHSYDQ